MERYLEDYAAGQTYGSGRIRVEDGSRRICSKCEARQGHRAVANGDEAALTLVYAATAAKLCGIIVRIVPCRDVAEDVLQKVYLHVWQDADAFDTRFGSPSTWVVSGLLPPKAEVTSSKLVGPPLPPEHANLTADGQRCDAALRRLLVSKNNDQQYLPQAARSIL